MNLDNAHALLIGVGADLPVTVKDARKIEEILTDPQKAGYTEANVLCLTEQNATRHKVIDALKNLVEKTSDVNDATVIVYYSGHGGIYHDDTSVNQSAYYLLTNGYDQNNRSETMLMGSEFSDLIDQINAKKLLVMLDCCHAAGMLGTKPLTKSVSTDASIVNSNVELLNMLGAGEGRVFITSCDDDEQSVILPGAENSLFTEVVLEALSGKASNGEEYVRVIELLYYILTQVPKRIKAYNHVQRPIINKIEFLSPDYYLCKSGLDIEQDDAVSYKMVNNLNDEVKLLIDNHNVSNSHTAIDMDLPVESNTAQIQIEKEEFIRGVERQIINGETKKAVMLFLEFTEKLCQDQRNNAILIAGRYNSLFKRKMQNLVTDENYRIELAKINEGLHYFLQECSEL